jgi:hypothetical protein
MAEGQILDALDRRVREAQDTILDKGIDNVGQPDLVIGVLGWQAEVIKRAVADAARTAVAEGIKAGVEECRRAQADADRDWRARAKHGGPWAGIGAVLTGAAWAFKELLTGGK